MAYEAYTGKSAGTIVKFNNVTIPDWTQIEIQEKGRPLPTPMDVTKAGDSVYTFTDDPLGGKTNPSATVTIQGKLDVKDKNAGAAGILQWEEGDVHDLIITVKTAADEYTLASAVLKTFVTSAKVAEIVPYTMTFTHSTSAGSWGTDS